MPAARYSRVMRTILALAALVAVPAFAQSPREALPASQELLGEVGQGNSDAELARAAAAASAHPFGTAANPARVGGPEGSRAYLARLRCANGAPPKVGDRTAAGVGAYGTIVEAWPLDCGAAAPGKVALVVDMYHGEHAEDRAPPGFTLQPR